MRNGKHGLRAIVLGIVVLGAMAFAAGAQAQTHEELLKAHMAHNKSGGLLNPNPLAHQKEPLGQFLVNLGAALLATIVAALEGTRVLLIAGRSLEVRCTGLGLIGAKIDSSTDALGEVQFTGCKVFDHKTLNELPNCQLKELETIRMAFSVLPMRHGGEAFLLFEGRALTHQEGLEAGLEGGLPPFAFVSFKPGIGCTLPLNNPVSGKFVALVGALDAVTQSISLSEGIQLLLGALLNFGGFPAYYTAKVTVELSGAHAGQKLGIH